MDHNGWIWRRRPSEKTIFGSHNPQQLEPFPEEEGQSNAAENLSEKLATVLVDDPHCNGANGNKPVMRISEAAENEGQQNVEIKLDEALKREMVMNEMLRFEGSKAVRDLEEMVTQLRAENSHMNNALLVKERALQDQQKHRSRVEAEFTSLISRLDSVEKENAFLKYECHVLEKEVEIRNEEMEYTRRSADAAQKESLEAANEIAKLEAECQRLHLALRRRLPGPTSGSRRTRRTNGGGDFTERDHEDFSRNLHLLVEQLQNVEAENRSLKEIVIKKDAEIQQSLELITSDSWHYNGRKFGALTGNQAIEVPEMRLMDDFAEMERLAIVSTEGGLKEHELSQVSDSAEPFDWLQVVLQTLVKQKGISKRSLGDLLEDVKIALGCGDYTCDERIHSLEQHPHDVCGYITWKGSNLSPTKDSSSGMLLVKPKDEQVKPEVRDAVGKIIELIEGIDVKSLTNDNYSSGEYSVHVLRWRASELRTILERFVCACKKQLGMEPNLGEFAEEVSFSLDYILNNCLNPNQASNTRDKIKMHFGWNMNTVMEPAAGSSDTLTTQLQESVTTIGGLKKEVKKLLEDKETMEDRIDDERSINEDLDTQLTVLKSKLNEMFQKCSSLEIELEYKNNCCEELEATCLELQLQLESVAREEVPKQGSNHERRLAQNGWEITAASMKLAECQETILNLGRQLKVLASPREAVLFDRVFSNSHRALTSNKKMNKRFSLRDQMQADDAAKAERLSSAETRGAANTSSVPECRDLQAQGTLPRIVEARVGSRREGGNNGAMALAAVTNKKPGISLLRRLLFRKKKGSSKAVGC